MTRYSSREVHGDGEHMYGNRFDAGEFNTYGRSRGPSSNAYSDGTSHDGARASNSSRGRQSAYERDGYPMEGAYGGEQDLRRYISRVTMGENSSHTDLPRRSSRGENTYPTGSRSGSERDLHRHISRATMGESSSFTDLRRRLGRDEQYVYDHDRRQVRRRPERERINDITERHQQRMREENNRDEEFPEHLRGYASRGFFPSYGYR